MPGNKKNGMRKAESVLGIVNSDLSLTIPEVDPQFLPDAGTTPSPPSGLSVTGRGATARISAQPQDLSRELPPCPQRESAFSKTGGRR
jgi:hypothetical protein